MYLKRQDPYARRQSMTAVKMGDRLVQVGCAHGGRLGAVAGKVGLSGRAVVVAPDEESAARARKGAAEERCARRGRGRAGDTAADRGRRVRSRGGRRHRRAAGHDARRRSRRRDPRARARVASRRPRDDRRRHAARRPRRPDLAHAKRTAVCRVRRRDQGARSRRVQIGPRARGAGRAGFRRRNQAREGDRLDGRARLGREVHGIVRAPSAPPALPARTSPNVRK